VSLDSNMALLREQKGRIIISSSSSSIIAIIIITTTITIIIITITIIIIIITRHPSCCHEVQWTPGLWGVGRGWGQNSFFDRVPRWAQ